jgi:hypothetical protein
MSHMISNIQVSNLKKPKKILDTALIVRKTTTMHPHGFSLPDPPFHLQVHNHSFLLTFRGAMTGLVKDLRLRTFTIGKLKKLNDTQVLQVTYPRQEKCNILLETNR